MTYREKALRLALRDLGVTENPPRSNTGPRVRKYLAAAGINTPAPWCMAFVNYMYEKAGKPIVHPHEASVGFFEDWARKQGYLVEKPERGDIVCYRFNADNWPDHVGIVEEVKGSRILTVEGNTSLSNDANGGQVMRRNRLINRCRFVRIPGDVPAKPKPPVVRPPGVLDPVVTTTTSVPFTYTTDTTANTTWTIDVTAGNVILKDQNPASPAVQSRLKSLFARFKDVAVVWKRKDSSQ